MKARMTAGGRSPSVEAGTQSIRQRIGRRNNWCDLLFPGSIQHGAGGIPAFGRRWPDRLVRSRGRYEKQAGPVVRQDREGDNRALNDIDGKSRRRSDTPRKSAKTVPTGSVPVGDALRGVYQETVNESIPSELLDLLGKLD